MLGITTIQVSKAFNERVKRLAELKASKLGLSKPFGIRECLEILVTEEENRLGADK